MSEPTHKACGTELIEVPACGDHDCGCSELFCPACCEPARGDEVDWGPEEPHVPTEREKNNEIVHISQWWMDRFTGGRK